MRGTAVVGIAIALQGGATRAGQLISGSLTTAPRPQPIGEGPTVDFVPGDICVVVTFADGAGDLVSGSEAIAYDDVRVWLNRQLDDLVAEDVPVRSALGPRHDWVNSRDWLRPKDPIFAAHSGGRLLQPWVVLPHKAETAQDSKTRVLMFYRVGAEDADRNAQLAAVQPVAGLINTHLAAPGAATGTFTVEAATPNWFLPAADDHTQGCPASRPEAAAAGDWRFTYTDLRLDAARQAASEVTLRGQQSPVVVAILDTCPDPAGVRQMADADFQSNRLMHEVTTSVALGDYPLSLSPSQSTYIHPGGYPSIPTWHVGHSHGEGVADDFADYLVPDHGLFVAGIVRDIAPQAEVHLIRILGDYGVGYVQALAQVLSELPAQLNPDGTRRLIVNLSLVASLPSNPSTPNLAHRSLEVAIQWLARQGALIVSSAGNEDVGRQTPYRVEWPMFPARYQEVLSVAAITKSGQKAWFSNRAVAPGLVNGVAVMGGDIAAHHGPEAHAPFIDMRHANAAPDAVDALVGIFSAPSVRPLPLDQLSNPTLAADAAMRRNESGWVYWSGTSFAVPIISGLAANLWAADPSLPPPVGPDGTINPVSIRSALQDIAASNPNADPKVVDLLGCDLIEVRQVWSPPTTA